MAERTNIPNDGMKAAARRALEWRKEGKRGGTGVGLARANQIVNGTNLSDSTVKRMYSFFSRHEVDKKATGFSSGEEGFPSPGRVAWDLWGGDAGFSWSRQKVASMKRSMEKAAKGFSVGDMVSWNSSGGTARGKIEYIMREGVLGIPKTKFSIEATKEDPAVLIRIYQDGKATETLVGHKMSTLRPSSMGKSIQKSGSVGTFVSWGSSGGQAYGKIIRIVRNGKVNVPDSSFEITGTPDDPAALIRIYRKVDGKWKPTDTVVGHKLKTVSPVSMSKSMHEMNDEMDDMEMPEDDWEGLNERQSDQADALCMIVEEYGQYDQSSNADGSHYADGQNNPFKADGLVCSSCIFYEQNACHIVSGNIDPEGICKLWIIPEEKIMEKNMDDSGIEKKDYNTKQRRALAGRGMAMPDGSYPIVNEQDLRNAIQSFGRASDPAATKRHIIKRARALGLIRLLPEEWNINKSVDSIWYGSLLPTEE